MRVLALRRGAVSGAAALVFLALAAAPARVAGACRLPGTLTTRTLWTGAGVLRDLAAVVLFVAPVVAVVAAVAPLGVARLRHARWQRAAGVLGAAPFAVAIWLFGVTAQEFKAERGSYPTLFDLAEGTSSAAFLKGTLGFLRYEVYWIPALVFSLAGAALLASRARRPRSSDLPLAWRPWLVGLAASLALGAAILRGFAAETGAAARGRFTASTLGDPFKAIVESVFDAARYGGKVTPRVLVRDAAPTDVSAAEGASLLGWPPPSVREGSAASAARCVHHPYARPLDPAAEPAIADARGRELVRAFDDVSGRLFPLAEDDGVVVWQITMESFRADDLHALNSVAARETAPFVNGLYEAAARGDEGVLASRMTYQAGVRTAQALGALSCGLGTLPYNLSIVRDLQPFPIRCLSDVLVDAGFHASFFYGSDLAFDGMSDFFRTHGFADQVGQSDLPADAPTGAWGAVTDRALVDETARRVATSRKAQAGPRFVMLTTLSNHSPFAAPADVPPEVAARVDHALATVRNHATRDDRARLLTHSYTDAALAQFFERLDAQDLAARSIVVLAADHSTGEAYVWGPEIEETDDAKSRIPFAIVLPRALRDRARDRPALDAALRAAQRALDAGALSQNDIPALILSLLREHPAVRAMPAEARWHTLGGQVTSPWFRLSSRDRAYVIGVNGISQFVAFDRAGARVGEYEESVFLKTRGDLSSVTPSLIPITATLSGLLRAPLDPCGDPGAPPAR